MVADLDGILLCYFLPVQIWASDNFSEPVSSSVKSSPCYRHTGDAQKGPGPLQGAVRAGAEKHREAECAEGKPLLLLLLVPAHPRAILTLPCWGQVLPGLGQESYLSHTPNWKLGPF